LHSSKIHHTASSHGLMQIACSIFPLLLTATLLIIMVVSVSPALIEATSPKRTWEAASSGHIQASVRQIQVSADGRQVHVVRHPAHWQLVDVETGAVQQQRTITDRFHSPLQRVKTPEDTVVYGDGRGCHLQSLWEDEPPTRLFSSAREIESIAASPESPLLAVHHQHSVELWSMTDGKIHATLELDGLLSTFAWSPDGCRLLVFMSDGRLQCRDGATLELLQSQPTPLNAGGRLAWSSSGRHVAAYSQSGLLVTWNLAADVVECRDTGIPMIHTIAYSPDGDYVIVPDLLRDVWVFPTTGNDRQQRYLGTASAGVSALCLVDDGKALLVGMLDGTVESWSMATGLPFWTHFEAIGMAAPRLESPSTEEELFPPVAQRGASCASTRS
jgi:hypothetical protein